MKRNMLLSILGCGVAFAGFATALDSRQSTATAASATADIHTVLDDQRAAWNRGDIDAFMKGYWNSPALSFAGTSGITRGWAPVMERYRKNYPDTAAMGHLDFSDIEIRLLGDDAALVLGRWHLKRVNDAPGGVFTLVFERFPMGWRIIHDHTSADAKP